MAHAQTDKIASVKFDIQILSVDLFTDVAEVNITVTIKDLPLIANLTPGEPVRAIVSSDFDHKEISCNETNGEYEGSSGSIDWTLGGKLGKGEYFPFERYELNFTLANVVPTLPNMTEIKGDNYNSFAYFAGSQRALLGRIFEANQVQEWMYVGTSFNNRTMVAFLGRKLLPGPIAAPVFFWQLMLPTIACYWLLAGTLAPTGTEGRRNRLTVYVSLFFFCPIFLLAIQGYLPLRASLSIPEVLIATLITSTAVLVFSSLFRVKSTFGELIKDGIALSIVIVSTLYLFNLFLPAFPISASTVVTLALPVPYYLLGFGLWTYRLYGELTRRSTSQSERMIALFGGFAVGVGLLSCTLVLLSMYVLIIGIVMLASGIFLIILSRRFKRVPRTSSPPGLDFKYAV
jgi:hypothetical protein